MTAKILHELNELKSMVMQSNINQKEVLTFGEAAMYLSLSESYLYQMVSKAQVPHYKPNGKKLYFSRKELDQWSLSNKTKSRVEIQEMVDNFSINKKRA